MAANPLQKGARQLLLNAGQSIELVQILSLKVNIASNGTIYQVKNLSPDVPDPDMPISGEFMREHSINEHRQSQVTYRVSCLQGSVYVFYYQNY